MGLRIGTGRALLVLTAVVAVVGLAGCAKTLKPGAVSGGGTFTETPATPTDHIVEEIGCDYECDDDDLYSSDEGGGIATIDIGGQTWMAENLNEVVEDSWCYEGDDANCAKYGRLYTWDAAKNACQSMGWRLPDTADWWQAVRAVSDTWASGKYLKANHGWHNDGNGTDDYNFSALPGGYRRADGTFNHAGQHGYWWTATEREPGSSIAYYRDMDYEKTNVGELKIGKGVGYSVRCVK